MGPKDTAAAQMGPVPAGEPASHEVVSPPVPTVPLVFASPHSGRDYPPEFLAQAGLDPLTLRRSEDAFVDELFADVPGAGAPLLKAHFPRVYLDPNREPFELDPDMFAEPLPAYVNRTSPRVAAGLGTIARVVATGEDIYRDKLSFAEATRRIRCHYDPYHAALKNLLDRTVERFGTVLLIDCHSMPSVGGPMDSDPGLKRVDFVLGDCHGTACAPEITNRVERTLTALGYTVRRNNPYAGGFTTRFYGKPHRARHALQIEINRTLYLDEERVRPNGQFAAIRAHIRHLIEALARIEPATLRRL